MREIEELEGQAFTDSLHAQGAAWLTRARARLAEGDAPIQVLLPAIARSVGKAPLAAARCSVDDVDFERGAWRCCDAAGYTLLREAAPDDETLVDLFRHGDIEERTIVLRAHALGPIRASTVELLGEIQRSNTDTHFEALVCDSNLLARAMRDGVPVGMTKDSGYKVLLKAAFIGIPLDRVFGIVEHASPELSSYILGLATEREAAGRAIWTDTLRVLAHSPIPGTVDRVQQGMSESKPELRLAATMAAATLVDSGDAAAAPLRMRARELYAHERDASIRTLLRDLSA